MYQCANCEACSNAWDRSSADKTDCTTDAGQGAQDERGGGRDCIDYGRLSLISYELCCLRIHIPFCATECWDENSEEELWKSGLLTSSYLYLDSL